MVPFIKMDVFFNIRKKYSTFALELKTIKIMRTIIIETKLGVNDTAFVLRGNKIYEVVIIGINIELQRSGTNMALGIPHEPNILISSYRVMFEHSNSIEEYSADEVFATKKELLDTL